MKIGQLFENWGLAGLKLNLGFLETEWEPQVKDSEAAWEMYVELLTRIATQPLPDDSGTERSALDSVYGLFNITRSILKKYGRESIGFAKIAVVILNQIVRPFTARWHKLAEEGAFQDADQAAIFRSELEALQSQLQNYMGLLADIVGIENIAEFVAPATKA